MSRYTDALEALEDVDKYLKEYHRESPQPFDYVGLAQADALRAIGLLLSEWVGDMPDMAKGA
jgi:hypothetical protein